MNESVTTKQLEHKIDELLQQIRETSARRYELDTKHAQERHESNGKFQAAFSESVARFSDANERAFELVVKTRELEREFVDIKHIVIGVDGDNGLRDEFRRRLTALEEKTATLAASLQDNRTRIAVTAAWVGGLVGGSVGGGAFGILKLFYGS